MMAWMHQRVVAMGFWLVCMGLAAGAAAADRPFPEAWYKGSPQEREAHAAMEGKPAPPLALSDWMNGEVTAEDMEGKVVVVDFWATWCAPCLANVPHMNEMMDQYAERGVLIVGVCGPPTDRMEAAVKKHDLRYPTGKDNDQQVAEAWSALVMPTYAVVDRKGVIRALGLHPDYVDDVVEKVLAEDEGEER